MEEGKGRQAKSSDEGEVRGQKGRNQPGYLPSFICSPLASARTMLRPGAAGICNREEVKRAGQVLV